ncbi:MAG: lipoprotein insertase outer membrane protein LolB [Halofilum sp. (in: g-proteobacteria)]|nr:lipoprotein insertase outer membrane protein LolB [Halofilum sp. (in: g-proteobacteria)]
MAPARFVLVLSAALLLGACTTGPRPLPDDRERAWDEARAQLRALDGWRAEGRLAVRTPDDGAQAHFTWQESADGRFALRLAGPWGQGAARLVGGAGQARLDTGEGREYSGPDARELLFAVYGWDIPVAALRRWLIGLPGDDAEYTLDRFGRVATLDWRDWSLEYRRYRQQDGLDLPALLIARRAADGVALRMAVDSWQLGGQPAAVPDSPVPLMGGG